MSEMLAMNPHQFSRFFLMSDRDDRLATSSSS
jgi:hypothetical protein